MYQKVRLPHPPPRKTLAVDHCNISEALTETPCGAEGLPAGRHESSRWSGARPEPGLTLTTDH